MITREDLFGMSVAGDDGVNSLVRLAEQLGYIDEDTEDDEYPNLILDMFRQNEGFIRAVLAHVHDYYDDYELQDYKYQVAIMEKHVGYVTVVARNKNEAIEKANRYIESEEVETEYDSTENIRLEHVELIEK